MTGTRTYVKISDIKVYSHFLTERGIPGNLQESEKRNEITQLLNGVFSTKRLIINVNEEAKDGSYFI